MRPISEGAGERVPSGSVWCLSALDQIICANLTTVGSSLQKHNRQAASTATAKYRQGSWRDSTQ